MDSHIIRLKDQPELLTAAAQWFHEKWGIPPEAYLESMQQCLAGISLWNRTGSSAGWA